MDIYKDIQVIKIKCPEPTKHPLNYCIILIYNMIQYFCIEKTYKYPVLCSWSIDAKHLVYGICDEDEELYVDCCIDLFIEEHAKEELMN